VAGAVLTRPNNDLWQAVLALHDGEKVLLGLYSQDQGARTVRNYFLPCIATGRLHRGTHQFEVHGAVEIGIDVELIVPVDDIILIVGLARRDNSGRRICLVGGKPVNLRSNENNFFARTLVNAEKDSRIAFLVDQSVFASFEISLPN